MVHLLFFVSCVKCSTLILQEVIDKFNMLAGTNMVTSIICLCLSLLVLFKGNSFKIISIALLLSVFIMYFHESGLKYLRDKASGVSSTDKSNTEKSSNPQAKTDENKEDKSKEDKSKEDKSKEDKGKEVKNDDNTKLEAKIDLDSLNFFYRYLYKYLKLVNDNVHFYVIFIMVVSFLIVKLFDIGIYILLVYVMFTFYDSVVAIINKSYLAGSINLILFVVALVLFFLVSVTKEFIFVLLFSNLGSIGALLSLQKLVGREFGFSFLYKKLILCNELSSTDFICLFVKIILVISGTWVQVFDLLKK